MQAGPLAQVVVATPCRLYGSVGLTVGQLLQYVVVMVGRQYERVQCRLQVGALKPIIMLNVSITDRVTTCDASCSDICWCAILNDRLLTWYPLADPQISTS